MLRFRETQRFPLWAEAILLLAGVVVPVGLWFGLPRQADAWAYLFLPAAMVLLYFCFFRMKTEVSDTTLTVTFGWIPCYRKAIPLPEILSAESVTYNPIRDYGGWGIRGIPVQALNARGNRGVRLTFHDGKKLLIGSQYPDELAQAICAPR